MNNMLYFSIVIPLYNKYEYIQSTIESVISQTYPYFEVIIVDDGSTDGSSTIIEQLNDKRIRLIRQENKGVSAARNRGVNESKFEFIAFIDGDDRWHKDFLTTIKNLIIVYPNLDLFATKFAIVKNQQIIAPFYETFPKNKNTTFNLFEIGYNDRQAALPINSSNIVIKKKALIEVGLFDERIHFFEDYDLFMRLAINGDIAFANFEPLSFYDQDVPIHNKATGKLPSLEKNLFYYTKKSQKLFKKNILFEKYYLKLFAIYTLDYWLNDNYHRNIKEIMSTIQIDKFPLKYKILYLIPYKALRRLIQLYNLLKKITKK
jgi:glycosyltransferase involved in cell wall biosynthesis